MENTKTINSTDVEYISIWDRPKRNRGRPKGSILSEEEKIERNREANKRCYYNNHDYYTLQKRIYKQQLNNTN